MHELTVVIPKEAAGTPLLTYLNAQGLSFSAPCGGNGQCGKCRVKLLEGRLAPIFAPSETLLPDRDGTLLACRALCCGEGAVLLLPKTKGEGLSVTVRPSDTAACDGFSKDFSQDSSAAFGVALDVGTTTLAAALVELSRGRVIATASSLNPQSGYGADVMSRIDAASKGMLGAMQALLLKSVSALIETLIKKASLQGIIPCRIERMTVAGNPTMLHILAGVSPEGMGKYPFTPVFLETKTLRGEDLGLPCKTLMFLPSASAFIGSDVMGGLLISGMRQEKKPTLLLDIGTNGEILLCTGKEKGNQLFAASAAAGPALEGARISCGMGGVDGAVSRVKCENGTLVYETVGEGAPRGLSGSGLVDFVAELLKCGEIDDGGYLEKESVRLVGRHKKGEGLSKEAPTAVTLLRKDVRELQLAKSALRASVELLLHHAKIAPEELAATYLAGGLGYYIDPENAVAIGLLPKALQKTVKPLGNTALSGAIAILRDGEALSVIESDARDCMTLELNEHALFSELFMEYMLF